LFFHMTERKIWRLQK